MNRRRMMLEGQSWAKEPLVIYEKGKTVLSNGKVVSQKGFSIGTDGLYVSCVNGSPIGQMGYFTINLEGIDIRKYRKLVATYKTGLSGGYTYSRSDGNKFGFGFSSDIEYEDYKSPEANSGGGTFVIDITKIKDPIYLYCEVPETVSYHDFATYGLGYMLFSDIHLE